MPPPPADSTRGIAVCEIYLDITCASLPSSSMDITQRPVTPDSLAQAPAPAAAQAAAMNTNVYLQGRLSNGLAYEFEVGAMDPDYVGRKTPSGWYIKASGIIAMEVVDEDKILVSFFFVYYYFFFTSPSKHNKHLSLLQRSVYSFVFFYCLFQFIIFLFIYACRSPRVIIC